MIRSPGSYWTFWPNPDAELFGDSSYQWGFVLKVNLTSVIGLLALFALPPIQAWTGCDLRILAVAFFAQVLYGAGVNLYGFNRLSPSTREFGSHLINTIAVVAIPLSSEKALFALWGLYPLIVWMDGYSNPKSVSSLLTSVTIPWLAPLWHADNPEFKGKMLMAGISVGLGVVIYLVSSYFAGWERAGSRRKAAAERESALREERERIGQSLHGTLGAALSEITLWHEIALANGTANGTAIGTANTQTDTHNAAPLTRAHERAKSALTELRALVAGLDDQGQERVTAAGLAAGIRRQIEGLCAASGTQLTFTEPAEGTTDMASAYHIAKIAVEGVTNAVRHARATHIAITLSLSPLHLTIADDGTGFDTTATSHGRGLRSLREHAAALGGTLVIESSPASGTRVIANA